MLLTDELRQFLREHPGLLWDTCLELRRRFGLTPEEIGEVLAQWIRETC